MEFAFIGHGISRGRCDEGEDYEHVEAGPNRGIMQISMRTSMSITKLTFLTIAPVRLGSELSGVFAVISDISPLSQDIKQRRWQQVFCSLSFFWLGYAEHFQALR
jgi:hypothetical protein